MSALVVALVGTDHHPFSRMVAWVDAAAARHPDVRFLIQHGSASRPPVLAEGHEFLTHDRLAGLLAEATGVICHGGPGTILDARDAGHVPMCVPRDPRLGEHVDGHQQRFAETVGRSGVVQVIGTLEELFDRLEHTLAHGPTRDGVSPATRVRDSARARLAVELDELITMRPHRLSRRPRVAL